MKTNQTRVIARSVALASGIALVLGLTSTRGQAQMLVNVSGVTTGIVGDTLLGETQVTLAAGNYEVTPTNPLLNASALYTAWSYNTPWTWYVLGYDDSNVVGSSPLINIDFGNANTNQGTPEQAYQQTYTEPTFTSAAAAYDSVAGKTQFFTLNKATTIDFITNDYYPPDNQGGVSFIINNLQSAASAPEPGSLGLLVSCGLAVLGVIARRRKFA